MSESEIVVLDTSALIALIDSEAGADVVRNVISRAVVSSVSWAEAHSVLSFRGIDSVTALRNIRFALQQVFPFTETQAEIAGVLRSSTQKAGLSLGDRACLALGLALNAPVYTADKAWKTINVRCDVRLIR